MANWEDIKKGVSDVAATATKKTSKYAEIAKLKYQIHEVDDYLDGQYEEIGRLYYNQMRHKNDNSDEITKLLLKVDETRKKMNDMTEKLDDIKADKICPKCGSKVNGHDGFCRKCGAKLRDEEAEE